MTGSSTPVEALLRRERLVVLAGLVAITGLAWWWVLIGAGTGMSALAMTTLVFPPPASASIGHEWTLGYAIIIFFMWWIMMIAMMTPSAAPTILLYARAHRHEVKLGRLRAVAAPTFAFMLGYLLAWLGFSVLATGAQWGLEQAGLVHSMLMWSVAPLFTGVLLLATGVYQLTPLKNVCLKQCRSPAQFLAENFRPGVLGAVRMGWKHGLFCLGCCWALMALLFAGGIMNLVWIAGLTIFVLLEKATAIGTWVARVGGVAMIGAGVLTIAVG
jgi:predicted metal-binding membrane protein